jgi:hypothetical protein
MDLQRDMAMHPFRTGKVMAVVIFGCVVHLDATSSFGTAVHAMDSAERSAHQRRRAAWLDDKWHVRMSSRIGWMTWRGPKGLFRIRGINVDEHIKKTKNSSGLAQE